MSMNHFKTVILLGALTGLFLGFGYLLGGYTGLMFGLVFSVLINFGTYWFSDKIVLKMYRAKETDNPELKSTVKEVADLANVPMPKTYIIPSQQLNAFATGRSPKNAAVACTSGLLKALSRDEIKGVIAHEMAHVKNRDILIQTVAATIAGIISYAAMVIKFGAIFGGMGSDRDNGGNMFSLLALAIITPIIAMLLQLALSRSREFLADESGAKYISNPYSLASALEKLENHNKHVPMGFGSEATSSLFIINPFRSRGLANLLSTHPSTAERVKRLRSM